MAQVKGTDAVGGGGARRNGGDNSTPNRPKPVVPTTPTPTPVPKPGGSSGGGSRNNRGYSDSGSSQRAQQRAQEELAKRLAADAQRRAAEAGAAAGKAAQEARWKQMEERAKNMRDTQQELERQAAQREQQRQIDYRKNDMPLRRDRQTAMDDLSQKLRDTYLLQQQERQARQAQARQDAAQNFDPNQLPYFYQNYEGQAPFGRVYDPEGYNPYMYVNDGNQLLSDIKDIRNGLNTGFEILNPYLRNPLRVADIVQNSTLETLGSNLEQAQEQYLRDLAGKVVGIWGALQPEPVSSNNWNNRYHTGNDWRWSQETPNGVPSYNNPNPLIGSPTPITGGMYGSSPGGPRDTATETSNTPAASQPSGSVDPISQIPTTGTLPRWQIEGLPNPYPEPGTDNGNGDEGDGGNGGGGGGGRGSGGSGGGGGGSSGNDKTAAYDIATVLAHVNDAYNAALPQGFDYSWASQMKNYQDAQNQAKASMDQTAERILNNWDDKALPTLQAMQKAWRLSQSGNTTGASRGVQAANAVQGTQTSIDSLTKGQQELFSQLMNSLMQQDAAQANIPNNVANMLNQINTARVNSLGQILGYYLYGDVASANNNNMGLGPNGITDPKVDITNNIRNG